MNKLHLKRFVANDMGTLGLLYSDVEFICFTLEDPVREVKIPGETAIPAGPYALWKRTYGRFYEAYKNRWNHEFVVELLDVPEFTNILIHTGNEVGDTEGCILVGSGCNVGDMSLTGSRVAYEYIFTLLDDMPELPYFDITDMEEKQ